MIMKKSMISYAGKVHWISYDLCIWYHTEPTRYHIPYIMICNMISYYDIMYDIMYTYDMILHVISYMISFHVIPVGSTPPSIAPAAAEPPCYAKTCSLRTYKNKKQWTLSLVGSDGVGTRTLVFPELWQTPSQLTQQASLEAHSWDDFNLTLLVYIYTCQIQHK